MATTDVAEIQTLVEGWAEQVGGTFVANVLTDTYIYLADVEEVPPGLFRFS